jgi:hypothetical protein
LKELAEYPQEEALSNWLGGWGGMAHSSEISVMGAVTYWGEKLFAAFGFDSTKYLDPDKLDYQTDTGVAVNIEDALMKWQNQCLWVEYWIVQRAFCMAVRKVINIKKNTEQSQMKALEKVAQVADTAGKTVDDALDALKNGLKAIGTIFDYAVPILLGIGGIWLLTFLGPRIAGALEKQKSQKALT